MIEPFLKWPGGKRWLVKKYSPLFPSGFRRYIEPFLGSGAVYFYLLPNRALLSDRNFELVNAYQQIKDVPESIDASLKRLQKLHSSRFYYEMRKTNPTTLKSRAVRFLYLNRTCFNGIYRVNLKGVFNVPMGTKTHVSYEKSYLSQISVALRPAKLIAQDFADTIAQAGRGDFLYVDPPYTVTHNNNGFLKYNDVLFSWDDQRRLALCVKAAAERGAMIFVSNADHASVRELYRGLGKHHTLSRSSILAASPAARRVTTELAVTNY